MVVSGESCLAEWEERQCDCYVFEIGSWRSVLPSFPEFCQALKRICRWIWGLIKYRRSGAQRRKRDKQQQGRNSDNRRRGRRSKAAAEEEDDSPAAKPACLGVPSPCRRRLAHARQVQVLSAGSGALLRCLRNAIPGGGAQDSATGDEDDDDLLLLPAVLYEIGSQHPPPRRSAWLVQGF